VCTKDTIKLDYKFSFFPYLIEICVFVIAIFRHINAKTTFNSISNLVAANAIFLIFSTKELSISLFLSVSNAQLILNRKPPVMRM